MTKSQYKKRHLKVVEYIYREYGKDFHFNRTRSGSLLIQLAPIHKHEFHLSVKTFANSNDSINNIAHNVVNSMYNSLYNITKDEWNIKYG